MLGSSLSRLFYNEHEIYAFHRDDECFSTCSADYSLDLTDLTQLQEIFSIIKPDLVIHCAGLINIDLCEKEPILAYTENVAITENIALSCSNGTKLVYISTDQVYGEAVDHSEANVMLQPVNKSLNSCWHCYTMKRSVFVFRYVLKVNFPGGFATMWRERWVAISNPCVTSYSNGRC